MYMYVCMDLYLYFRYELDFKLYLTNIQSELNQAINQENKKTNQSINQQTKQATSKPANQLTILQLISTPTVAPKLNFKS